MRHGSRIRQRGKSEQSGLHRNKVPRQPLSLAVVGERGNTKEQTKETQMKQITIDDDVDFTETEEFADAFIDMVCGGGGGRSSR